MIEPINKASGTTFNLASGQGIYLVEVGQTMIDRLDATVDWYLDRPEPFELILEESAWL